MIDEIDKQRILTKITLIGLAMNVIIPVTILVVAALMNRNAVAEAGGIHWEDHPGVKTLFYVFLVIAAADFVAAIIIRRRLPAGIVEAGGKTPLERFENSAVRLSIIMYSLNASHAFYGLALYILGADIEVLILFAALSMIGYQLLRPRSGYLDQLWKRFDPAAAGPGP